MLAIVLMLWILPSSRNDMKIRPCKNYNYIPKKNRKVLKTKDFAFGPPSALSYAVRLVQITQPLASWPNVSLRTG